MNREKILDKHLDGIFLPEPTRKAVLAAMEEVDYDYVQIMMDGYNRLKSKFTMNVDKKLIDEILEKP